jgi:hypothetical protein
VLGNVGEAAWIAGDHDRPPSARMFCPVIQPLSGWAISATRLAVGRLTDAAQGAHGGGTVEALGAALSRSRSVSAGPAEIVLAVIPRRPSSCEQFRVSCSTAALDAAETAAPGLGHWVPTVDRAMMRPLSRSREIPCWIVEASLGR